MVQCVHFSARAWHTCHCWRCN